MPEPTGSGPITARAYPRAGILGNPSDLYGGRGVGFTFSDFHAEVRLIPDDAGGGGGAPELPLLAAAREVLRRSGDGEAVDGAGFRLTFTSDVPRQAGLSGSSAIVVAALRAIRSFALRRGIEVDLEPRRLADLALRAENDVLGTVAGPMDRVLQAHEGLLAMDFADGVGGPVERLPRTLFPEGLVLLIDEQPGQDSGAVHNPVRERWEAGDPLVRETMAAFRPLVEEGLRALRGGDLEALCQCIDKNFDLRAAVFTILARDRSMVDTARAHGFAAKFCGSGGAVLALPRPGGDPDGLRAAVRAAGWRWLEPTLVG